MLAHQTGRLRRSLLGIQSSRRLKTNSGCVLARRSNMLQAGVTGGFPLLAGHCALSKLKTSKKLLRGLGGTSAQHCTPASQRTCTALASQQVVHFGGPSCCCGLVHAPAVGALGKDALPASRTTPQMPPPSREFTVKNSSCRSEINEGHEPWNDCLAGAIAVHNTCPAAPAETPRALSPQPAQLTHPRQLHRNGQKGG
jgi:hypothetical protein